MSDLDLQLSMRVRFVPSQPSSHAHSWRIQPLKCVSRLSAHTPLQESHEAHTVTAAVTQQVKADDVETFDLRQVGLG